MSVDPEATTQPIPLRGGDRIALENRIDVAQAELHMFMAQQKDRADVFYSTRMVPLEEGQRRAVSRSSISMALSIVALAGVFLVLVLVVLLHALR